MGLALVIMSLMVCAQMVCIWALLNRLLKQAGIKPIVPRKPEPRPEVLPPLETRRKLFSIPFSD